MNLCSLCNYKLVDIVYGYPTPELIEMARDEKIALGGTCVFNSESPRLYCYGCHEAFISE